MGGFDRVRRWLETNAHDLALDAENPAQFTWELEQLRLEWKKSFSENLRLQETWKVLQRHPRIWDRAVAEGVTRADVGDADNGEAPARADEPEAPAPEPEPPAAPRAEDRADEPAKAPPLPVHVPRRAGPHRLDLVLGIGTLILIAGVVILAIVAAIGGLSDASPSVALLAVLAGVLVGYHLGRRSSG